jgi:F0F1-type ATP synthase membrane subunit c/vacuolar-type H+-ATPase subunit K
VAGDPGWQLSPLHFVPFGARVAMMRSKRSGASSLVVLRQVFVSFCTVVVLFAVVVAMVARPAAGETSRDVGTWTAVVVLVGAVALTATRMISARRLDTTDATTLGNAFRTRFFLGLATAESVALVGFVGAFLALSPAVYLLAAVMTLVGFALIAPTRVHLEREDEALRAAGSTISLYEALA